MRLVYIKSKCTASLFAIIFLFLSVLPSAAADKPATLADLISHVADYNIEIVNWQNQSYAFDASVLSMTDRGELVAYLEQNLINWASVDEERGWTRFFLLPLGVPANDFITKDHTEIAENSDKQLKRLSGKHRSASSLKTEDFFTLPAMVELSDAVTRERAHNMFFDRRVMLDGMEVNDYTFSVVYNEAAGKFMPYMKNGMEVPGTTMEGFVCYDTVYNFLATKEETLQAAQKDGWVFLALEDQEDSYMAVNGSDGNLEIAAVSATADQNFLEYHITAEDAGFTCTTIIPTPQGEMVLTDVVTYFPGEQ